MEDNQNKKGNIWGLLPMVVFLVLFLGTGIITKDFSSMPINIAFLMAGIVAVLMNKNKNIEEKVEIFCRGAGESNIIMMTLVFIMAGIFANVAIDMGAVEAIVNFGLSVLPGSALVAGLFVISSFIAISIGTSLGTIVSLTPIAVGISQETGIIIGICVAAVVGGAMFGDNLSVISDTTIAATRTQGCGMREKSKANFMIVLPAAILTTILFAMLPLGQGTEMIGEYSYNIIKIIPYFSVLILALTGMNVLVVLVIGIILAGTIGIIVGEITLITLLASMYEGAIGMEDLVIIALLVGGLAEIIKSNRGFEYLINLVGARIKGKKGAELGITFLICVVNICTANNTISIVMVGPLAKDISKEYGIEPKRSASLLDIFSSAIQGMVPYGGQLLAAAGLASISVIDIMKYNFYPYLIFITAVIVILFVPTSVKKAVRIT